MYCRRIKMVVLVVYLEKNSENNGISRAWPEYWSEWSIVIHVRSCTCMDSYQYTSTKNGNVPNMYFYVPVLFLGWLIKKTYLRPQFHVKNYEKNAFLLLWFMSVGSLSFRSWRHVPNNMMASWVPKNNLLFLECTHLRRHSVYY